MKESAFNGIELTAGDIGAPSVPTAAAADDLDDLFDYDVFRDVDTNMDVPSHQKVAGRADGKEHTVGLGIDEEIKVSKKRAPVPKLDEERLLGPAGIPKLRRITRERLKFKGKGHEYSDVSRLLTVYQLWLDELYPRAKFADGLAIIEKLGHSKRMQTMRRQWISEAKPKETLETLGNSSQKQACKRPIPEPTRDGLTTAVPAKSLETQAANDDDDMNYYTATLQKGENEETSRRTNPTTQSLFVSDEEDVYGLPPVDDLDVLLGEDQGKPPSGTPGSQRREDNFDDEMEAMASVDDL